MKNVQYPAIFRKQDKGYFVEFPDLPGCVTEGETLDQAILMAGDALNIWITNKDENSKFATPSSFELIKEQYSGEIVLLIKPQIYESEGARKFMLNAIIEDSIEKKGLTVKEVAKKLEMDLEYFKKVISGDSVPTLAEANMIAYLLEIEPQLFYMV